MVSLNVVHVGYVPLIMITLGGLGTFSLARGDTFTQVHISSLLASAIKQFSIEHNLNPNISYLSPKCLDGL